MSDELIRNAVKGFIASSKSSIETLVKAISSEVEPNTGRVTLYFFDDEAGREMTYDASCFFLRTSMEYSSPQLTVEELEGLLAARLLEICVNCRLNDPESFQVENIGEAVEALRRPPRGKVVPFILETDDVEPDRYSYNPLRSSIVESGQSAFPAANVSTEGLKLDENFVKKYGGTLVSKDEAQTVEQRLGNTSIYVDFVDSVKRTELDRVYEELGLELRLPQLRMPLDTLAREGKGGNIHSLVQASHRDYETIEALYNLMGRNFKNKTLLPTVPHSPRGYGSKRAARGKLVFLNETLASIRTQYQTMNLYPNMMDPNDLSIAKCEDSFEVPAGQVTDYSYVEAPSSPQFALYALFSPEDASLWHGVGEYSGNEILRSYASVQTAFLRRIIFPELRRPRLRSRPPIMFNLDPSKMWQHPIYGNIDGGIGCVEDISYLLRQEVKVSTITAKLRETINE